MSQKILDIVQGEDWKDIEMQIALGISGKGCQRIYS